MPRLTRAQAAAALQDAAVVDDTKLQPQREPFEEVNANVKSTQVAKPRTTRARSKAGTRKENYDSEDAAALSVPNDAKDDNSNSTASIVSGRSIRSRGQKTAETVIQDEVHVEVIIKRSTRSTRRQQPGEPTITIEGVVETPAAELEIEIENAPVTPANKKPTTRATRASVKRAAMDTETTERRTRRKVVSVETPEQILEANDPGKSPVEPVRGRAALKTGTSPSRIPSPIKESPEKTKIQTPAASPIRSTLSRNASPNKELVQARRVAENVQVLPARPELKSPVAKPISPITPRVTRISLAQKKLKSTHKIPANEPTAAETPGNQTLSTTPVSRRIAAVEKQSKVKTPPIIANKLATVVLHTKLSPEKSGRITIENLPASTPIRPAMPVSLTSIKRSQTQTPIKLATPTPINSASRPTTTSHKIGTPAFNRTVGPTYTPSYVKKESMAISPIKAPSTPARIIKVKPSSLRSPFVASPSLKATPRIASISIPLGSFASPTKSHLARQSLAAASRSASGDEEGSSSHGTSMIVNITKVRLEKQPPANSATDANQPVEKKPVTLPSVLRKKAPVVATTKAALLRARKVSGQTLETPPMQQFRKPQPPNAAPILQRSKAPVPAPSETTVPPRLRVATQNPRSVNQSTKSAPSVKAVIKPQPLAALAPISKPPGKKLVHKITNGVANTKEGITTAVASIQAAVMVPTISISKPEPEVTVQSRKSIAPIATKTVVAPAGQPSISAISNVGVKADDTKGQELVKVAPKLGVRKKPFQPAKSTKPLTIPVPFQRAVVNKTETQPTTIAVGTEPLKTAGKLSSIKDRIQKFEAPKPKPKPVPFVEARALLREARKEARKGTLPKLTGEVEYAALPEVETEPRVEIPEQITQSIPAPVLINVISDAGPARRLAEQPIPRSASPAKAQATSRPVSPAKVLLPLSRPASPVKMKPAHEVIAIPGSQRPVSPAKSAFLDDVESMRRAKERAEASIRGHQAVLDWASKARKY